jgi:hypothetical protein
LLKITIRKITIDPAGMHELPDFYMTSSELAQDPERILRSTESSNRYTPE